MPDRNGYIGRAPSDSSVTIARQINQPTSTTSTFVFNSGYDVGYLDVYVNGTKLINVIEYAATDTQNITLTTAVGNGDKVEFVAYKSFNLSNIVSSTLANLTVNGDITSQNINSSGIVTATSFAGALTGNVTGNLTGNATGLTGIPNISCGTGAFSGAVTLQDNLDLQDNDKILLGSGDDLEIYHNGTLSYIDSKGTQLRIESDAIRLRSDGGETYFEADVNGAAKVYYDNSTKLTTKSDGIDVTGELQCDSLDVDGTTAFADDVSFDGVSYGARWDKSENQLEIDDNAKIIFGNSADLQIYHDATNCIIQGNTGDLQIIGAGDDIIIQAVDDISIKPQNGENGVNIIGNGAVELYHDNSKKLETSATGVTVTGTLNATTDVQINGKGVATAGKAIAMSMVFG